MIKLCWWLFRTLIWGNDFKIDFNFSVDFEEAMIYLKKGYFIRQTYPYNINRLYAMIGGTIYVFDLNKKTSSAINGFSNESLLNGQWEIIPFSEQVNWGENNNG